MAQQPPDLAAAAPPAEGGGGGPSQLYGWMRAAASNASARFGDWRRGGPSIESAVEGLAPVEAKAADRVGTAQRAVTEAEVELERYAKAGHPAAARRAAAKLKARKADLARVRKMQAGLERTAGVTRDTEFVAQTAKATRAAVKAQQAAISAELEGDSIDDVMDLMNEHGDTVEEFVEALGGGVALEEEDDDDLDALIREAKANLDAADAGAGFGAGQVGAPMSIYGEAADAEALERRFGGDAMRLGEPSDGGASLPAIPAGLPGEPAPSSADDGDGRPPGGGGGGGPSSGGIALRVEEPAARPREQQQRAYAPLIL